jgi:biopolymer transport protein ExbD
MPKITGAGCAIAKIEINMTPMIDVVFQLLTFFLMTFKVAAAEGDFDLRLPREVPPTPGTADGYPDEILIRLTAGADGDLAAIQIETSKPFVGPTAFAEVTRMSARIVQIARDAGQEEPTARIVADDGLRYEFVLQAIAAASSRLDAAGNIEPLFKKVRLAQQ